MPFTETECMKCREDFPALQRELNGTLLAYFDGPAGSQVPQQVIDSISHYYRTFNANAHGEFITSLEVDRAVEECRDIVAQFLNAPSGKEISFGANMTSLTFSLSHALSRILQTGDEIVITQLDHEANRGPWLNLQEKGIVVKEVKFNRDGYIDYEDLEQQINKKTRIVAIGYASNALGTINDIALARRLSKEVGAYLVIDAVHFAPHFPIDVTEIDADFLLCSAYKFYGPHVGVLYSRPGLLDELPTDVLRTQIQDAPFRIETGTPNFAGLMGVKAAIEYIASWGKGSNLREQIVTAMQDIAQYEHELGSLYHDNVLKIEGVNVWGPDFSDVNRAPTISITIDGMNSKEAAKKLGEKGILVWNGHFYAIRAVEVLGLVEQGGLIRTGMLMYNTKDEVERLIQVIGELV
jgi:cysteine desulfurase family protein (TIGR01976 family)